MGLGVDPSEIVSSATSMNKTHRNVGLLSIATWVGGMVMGSDTAKNIGIGGLLAIVYVEVLAKKYEPAPPAPLDVQGWG
jgi:hypothetical protein